jgi:hypothetical protein
MQRNTPGEYTPQYKIFLLRYTLLSYEVEATSLNNIISHHEPYAVEGAPLNVQQLLIAT